LCVSSYAYLIHVQLGLEEGASFLLVE